MSLKNGLNYNLNGLDAKNVTCLYNMFYNSQFNQDISNWNVSNVTDMSWMFNSMGFEYE